jgi:hypothetical protein
MTKLAIVGATDPPHSPAGRAAQVCPDCRKRAFKVCHCRADARRLIGHRHLGLTFRWIGGAVASPFFKLSS